MKATPIRTSRMNTRTDMVATMGLELLPPASGWLRREGPSFDDGLFSFFDTSTKEVH